MTEEYKFTLWLVVTFIVAFNIGFITSALFSINRNSEADDARELDEYMLNRQSPQRRP